MAHGSRAKAARLRHRDRHCRFIRPRHRRLQDRKLDTKQIEDPAVGPRLDVTHTFILVCRGRPVMIRCTLCSRLSVAAVVAQSGQTYNPTGPKIQFTMSNGGSFVIATDPKTSPKTVAYILDLVKRKYYDGQRVHRVEWWVTQWGAGESKTEPMDVIKDGKKEPNDKVASGGWKKDIPVFEPGTNIDYVRGMVGIASTGHASSGRLQIFVLKQDATRLYGSYAVLGEGLRKGWMRSAKSKGAIGSSRRSS